VKISELIAELRDYQKQEGDIEVYTNLPFEGRGWTKIEGAHLRGRSSPDKNLPKYFVALDWV